MEPEAVMQYCFQLARKGCGSVEPNPVVGAAIVKDGKIIASGYHQEFGGPHAEIVALQNAGPQAKGATLYMSLEPCCHTEKKTPPCVPSIIEAGIREVVIAARDPNPKVNGKGVSSLRKAGIRVREGVLKKEAAEANKAFFTEMRERRPWITLKLAMTADGKIATKTGDSKWISSEDSRTIAHRLRAEHQAVLVGVNTVIRDDPELTVRLVKGRNPTRIVLDASGRISAKAKVLDARNARTIVMTNVMPIAKERQIRARGAEVWHVPSRNGHVVLRAAVTRLLQEGLQSVLVEGGSEVAGSFVDAGLVDEVCFFIAPKLLGGGISAVGGKGKGRIADSLRLREIQVERIGDDLLYRARVART